MFVSVSLTVFGMDGVNGMISGRVVDASGHTVDYATVLLKGTHYGCVTDTNGLYHINAPAGRYIVSVSAPGDHKHTCHVGHGLQQVRTGGYTKGRQPP